MLKKKQRLTTTAFNDSFKKGKRYHCPELQLIHDLSKKEFHGAVVVGKKVYKTAVARNRLRRQIYSFLYNYNKQHFLSGTYIVIAKPSAKDIPAKEIKEKLKVLLMNCGQ